jgi:hypothetical protein
MKQAIGSNFIPNLKRYLRAANQQFLKTPERALDCAYEAALAIKAIENEHFAGKAIAPNSTHLSHNVSAYFQRELQKYLKVINFRLSEFKVSQSVVGLADSRYRAIAPTKYTDSTVISAARPDAIALKKLKVIDEILTRYTSDLVAAAPSVALAEIERARLDIVRFENQGQPVTPNLVDKVETLSDATGVLPRSILGIFNRIQRQLDPKAEEKVVQSFRNSRTKTLVSLKLIMLLIIVPLVTQQFAKDLLIGPIVDHFRGDQSAIFINSAWKQEALEKLRDFEEELKFDRLIGLTPTISQTEVNHRLTDKAEEIAEEFRQEGNGAVKNVFADLLAVIAFMGILLTHQRELIVLKSFLDDLVYGLNDSAKAFIIILFTDTFVGYHSSEGWEVLLKGFARHFGLPENENLIYLFIAIVPVGMATVFKFWIFRYLNSISPSAVATYKEMNE